MSKYDKDCLGKTLDIDFFPDARIFGINSNSLNGFKFTCNNGVIKVSYVLPGYQCREIVSEDLYNMARLDSESKAISYVMATEDSVAIKDHVKNNYKVFEANLKNTIKKFEESLKFKGKLLITTREFKDPKSSYFVFLLPNPESDWFRSKASISLLTFIVRICFARFIYNFEEESIWKQPLNIKTIFSGGKQKVVQIRNSKKLRNRIYDRTNELYECTIIYVSSAADFNINYNNLRKMFLGEYDKKVSSLLCVKGFNSSLREVQKKGYLS